MAKISTVLFCRSLLALLVLPTGLAEAQSTWQKKTSGTNKALRGVAHDGQRFVVVADEGVITNSTDGLSWSTVNSGTTMSLRGITSSPNGFVATGENGTLLTSADGALWTAQVTPPDVATKLLSGVAFGGGTYVAVGGSGKIIHSSDAVTWMSVPTVPLPFFLQSVTFGAGRFVAVGVSGTIMYSDDAATWHAATSGTPNFLTHVTWANGQFVIVGLGGTILTSSDGNTWTAQTSGTAAWLRCIVNADGRYLVGGDAGTILASVDGITWEAQTSGVPEAIFGLCYGSNKFVGVGGKVALEDPGANSMVATSPTGLDLGFRWATLASDVSEIAGVASLTVERIGPDDVAVEAAWSVTGGSAVDSEDFTPNAGTIDFAVGELERQITFSILDDPELEGVETIEITLSAVTPDWRVHGPALSTIAIIDDEDSDSDGLGDAWELQFFPSLSVHDGSSDPDGDGNDNAREFSDGTDPGDPNSAKYTLTAAVAVGSGTIALSPDQASYDAGDQITLTANGTSGFGFSHWGGDLSGDLNPLTIVIGADTTLTASFVVTLAAALDQTSVEWFTGSTGYDWVGQTTITSDGIDAIAAEGGTISQGESIVVEAIAVGPANLSFQWKVSSAPDVDFLRFFIDGNEKDAISGEVGWIEKVVSLGPGPHHVMWSYERDFGPPDGNNAAWLDQVQIIIPFALWQTKFFTAGELADPLISGPDADPDFDGLSNFHEYAFVLDPRTSSPASSQLRISRSNAAPPGDYIAICYARPVTRLGEVEYMVETSTTMLPGSWMSLAGSGEVIADEAGVHTLRYVAAASPRGFYRMRVSVP